MAFASRGPTRTERDIISKYRQKSNELNDLKRMTFTQLLNWWRKNQKA